VKPILPQDWVPLLPVMHELWVASVEPVSITYASTAWWVLGAGMEPCCKLTGLMKPHYGVACCCSVPDLSKIAQDLAEVKAALAPYKRVMTPAQVGAGILVAQKDVDCSRWLPSVRWS
jgi:hypothetical protein